MTGDTTTVLFANKSEDNPYHELLIEALLDTGVKVVSDQFPAFFPFTTKAVLNDEIDAVQVGWMYQFYMASPTNNSHINTIITTIRTLLFLFDLLIVSFSKTTLVWTVHNVYNHEKRYKKFEKAVNEFTLWAADAVTVKCKSAAKSLTSEFWTPTEETFTVIRDGNYNKAYPNETSRSNSRSELGVRQDAFVYVFFGRVRDYKGIDILIESFKQIEDDKTELWVVGNPWDDRIKANLREQGSHNENITFVFEFIPNESVQTYLNMADVLVLPYRSILNSGSVHLGLTFGLPIIAPKMGCIPSTVPPENSELLYDGSREGLKRALTTAREHSELGEIAGSNREQAEEYDWLTPAQQLAAIYRKDQ